MSWSLAAHTVRFIAQSKEAYSVLRRMTDLLWTFGLAAPNYCIDPCQLYEYMSTFVDSVEVDTRYTRNMPPFSHCDLSLYLFTFTRRIVHSVQAQGVGAVIHHSDHPPTPPIHKPLFEN